MTENPILSKFKIEIFIEMYRLNQIKSQFFFLNTY